MTRPAAPRSWWALAAPLAALVAWEAAARLGWISPLFFPAPTAIAGALQRMLASGDLAPHAAISLHRLALGFALGGGAGLLLGWAMGISSRLRAAVDPWVAATHPIPKIAVLPLILVIFGIGEASKVVSVALAAFFPMAINALAGVRLIDAAYFDVARNYGGSRWAVLTQVVVPGSLPAVLAGARLALNAGLVVGLAVEALAAPTGLGRRLWFAWQTLRTEELYAGLVAIAAIGIGLNAGLSWCAARLAPWHAGQQAGG